jgi:glycosyltransferase involved in cell wall biosynthesis
LNIVYLAPFAFSPKATVSARMLPMATALVRRGHRVTILMPPYDNPADAGNVWEHEGVRLENRLVGSEQWAVGGSYINLARQLAQRTRQINPDVIHVFKPIGVSALAMWLLHQSAIGNRQSAILDNDDWEGPGGWLDVNPYSPAQKLFFRWQERWALRAAPQVTCASEVLVERTHGFRTNSRRDAGDIHLLPNGPDEVMRAQVARSQDRRDALRAQFGWGSEPVVIYAGTIPLNHDLDVVVKALRNLVETRRLWPTGGYGASVRWVIVATGDGIPSLKQAIAQAGIGKHIEWHGFMPHERLVEYLVAADVAVYPYRDTNINRAKCSGKVMDYMACGLPMVVSDVGMNRVYLEDGVSGLLTPPGDAEAFGAALSRLIEDRPFALGLGHAAQTRIWDAFGWDKRVAQLESIYAER